MRDDVDAFSALERRVTALERRAGRDAGEAAVTRPGATEPVLTPGPPDGRWWVLDHLATHPAPVSGDGALAGSVVYGGRTLSPGGGEVAWQAEHPLAAVLGADLGAAALVLAALGHPVRLALLVRLLLGAHTLTELQQVPGVATTGQLHHHLKELRGAGLVLHQRNHYSLSAPRVVPWLVMIAAAVGSAGVPPAAPPTSEVNGDTVTGDPPQPPTPAPRPSASAHHVGPMTAQDGSE